MGVSTAGWGRLPLAGDAGCLTNCRKNILTRPPRENRFEGRARDKSRGDGQAGGLVHISPARKGVGSPKAHITVHYAKGILLHPIIAAALSPGLLL